MDKDLVIDLPAGVVGNPAAVPKCPVHVFLSPASSGVSNCPQGSQIGTFAISGEAAIFTGGDSALGLVGERNPIYNLVPESGYPAELGFYDLGVSHGVLAPAIVAHTEQGYVVRIVSSELITGVAGPYFLQTSIFGNPRRAAGLPDAGNAFLTNPASCSGQPLRTELHLDTWVDPAAVPTQADGSRDFGAVDFSNPQWLAATAAAPAVAGCESLQFNPTLRVAPTESSSDSASGLDVRLLLPQNEDPEGQATPPLRDAVVALPAGLVVDPSSANGLGDCTEDQIAANSTQPGRCPGASKLGSATLNTPLIDHALEGSVYLGTPACSPCKDQDASAGRLLRLYIEIDDPSTGVVVKLPGTVSANPENGQLTATFKDNPQFPFENLQLHFKSGPRAPLTTPPTCGEYSTRGT